MQPTNTPRINPDQVIAIEEYMHVLKQLSHKGLQDLLVKSFKVTVVEPVPSKTDLMELILVEQYGADTMAAYHNRS